MLKSLADTVSSFTSATCARVAMVASQLVGLQPIWLVLGKSNAHDSNCRKVLLSKMGTWERGRVHALVESMSYTTFEEIA
jgi:hypothetical protein